MLQLAGGSLIHGPQPQLPPVWLKHYASIIAALQPMNFRITRLPGSNSRILSSVWLAWLSTTMPYNPARNSLQKIELQLFLWLINVSFVPGCWVMFTYAYTETPRSFVKAILSYPKLSRSTFHRIAFYYWAAGSRTFVTNWHSGQACPIKWNITLFNLSLGLSFNNQSTSGTSVRGKRMGIRP